MRKTFVTKLESQGPGNAWTFMQIPFAIQEAFGSKARVSVKGTITGFSFRSSLFPNGDGTHHMMVNKAMQKGAKARPGEELRVQMKTDSSPRTVNVPHDLTQALGKAPAARKILKTSLSP